MNNKPKLQPGFKRISTLLPVLIPVLLFGAIWGLAETIKDEKARMTAEKMKLNSTERPPANVVVLDLSPVTMEDRINLPGVIEPWQRLPVIAKIEGTVLEIKVAEGEKVTKGQLLVLLEPADRQIALASAKAEYELAAANQKRVKLLYGKKIVPKAEVEEVTALLKTSKARLNKAQLMLSRCKITAPSSGVVQQLEAKEGLFLNAHDPVAEILQIDRVKAVVGIPESDVALVRSISEVPLTIQALDNKKVTGQFHFLASSPDTNARLYTLELEIENNDNQILPGMFFRAELVKRVIRDTISVPLFSVIRKNNDQFVYIEENGIARQSSVELGIIDDWQVQIRKGLPPGSRLIVEGHRSIDQGHKLNVVRVVQDLQEVLL